MTKHLQVLLVAFSLVLSTALPVFAAQDPAEPDRRIGLAKIALDEAMTSQDNSIPEELLAKCKAIAIYPRVAKGAFIFGARYGRGIVLKKKEDGTYGPLAFSTLGGGNVGLQIGGQVTDYILVIMNDRGLESLLSNNFTLGADASFAAGPIGRKSSANTDLYLKAGILAYAHSRGLFGGISLDGAVLTQDNNTNSFYYGKSLTSRDILLGGGVEPMPSSKELIETLDRYSTLWASTPHNNITEVQSGQAPDYQGYVESFDYSNSSVTLIDSRPMQDKTQGKVANLSVKLNAKDLASLRLEDEIQVFFDKAGSVKQREAKSIVKLPSSYRAAVAAQS